MKNVKIDKKSLESDILYLHKEIKELADYEHLPKIIIDIHGPGWTTIAEILLFQSIVKSNIKLVTQLKENLKALELGNEAIKQQ